MRIVSLLPAATEIVARLGQFGDLVGISHECDFPQAVNKLPRVTHAPLFEVGLSSAEIDRRVRETLAAGESLYHLDEQLLREIAPDVILTQQLCDVCAVGYGSVAALASTLPSRPRLVNLEPQCLADVFANIQLVGDAIDAAEQAAEVTSELKARVAAVYSKANAATARPRVFLIEWIEPLFCSGHWGPELVDLAGGQEIFNCRGQSSIRVSWDDVLAAAPEVIVVACCGYKTELTLADLPLLRALPRFETLPAVKSGRVYISDGNAYFHRPGPRIVDTLEILAEAIHPEQFEGKFPNRGVIRA